MHSDSEKVGAVKVNRNRMQEFAHFINPYFSHNKNKEDISEV